MSVLDEDGQAGGDEIEDRLDKQADYLEFGGGKVSAGRTHVDVSLAAEGCREDV